MEERSQSDLPSERPSFNSRLTKWHKIGAPFSVLHWIERGVPLPLHNVPRLRVLRNHHLDDLQTAFVEEEIDRLIRSGAIRLLGSNESAFVSPIGVVPKKNGKSRLIIDMRLLNVSVSPPKFKYKDLSTLAPLLRSGDFITMIDLKDGFHHVSVLLAHQHLLAFAWQNQKYAFQVLLFGLVASPWIFTCYVRATGIRVMAYMDDVIILGQSYAKACRHTTFTLRLFGKLGWVVNTEKSDTTLSQCKEFLGLMVDMSSTPTFRVPLRKAHDLRHDIDRLLRHAKTHRSVPV